MLAWHRAEFHKDHADLVDRPLDRVVHNLKPVLIGPSQLAPCDLEPPLDGRLRFGTASPQAALQFRIGTGPQEYGGNTRKLAADLLGTVDVDIYNYPLFVVWARSDLA